MITAFLESGGRAPSVLVYEFVHLQRASLSTLAALLRRHGMELFRADAMRAAPPPRGYGAAEWSALRRALERSRQDNAIWVQADWAQNASSAGAAGRGGRPGSSERSE